MKKMKAKPVMALAFASTLLLSGSNIAYSTYKEINLLEKELQQLSKSHKKLKKQHDVLLQKHTESLKKLDKLKDQNQQLFQENQQLIQENQNLKRKLQESDDTVKRLQQKVRQLSFNHKKDFVNVSRGEREGDWIYFLATYYDANYQSTGKHPGDAGYGITKSGKPVQAGVTIAVDPNIIPLGTWVLIKYPDGRIEKRQAQDTGKAIKGYKIDIYIPEASITSGKHFVQVKILD
jgi:3D (Asp-Asp-Asp) domain-containing protein